MFMLYRNNYLPEHFPPHTDWSIYFHVNLDNKITPLCAWAQNLQTKNHKTWHVDRTCCFESKYTYKFKFLSIQQNPSPHPLHNFKPWSSKTQNELLLFSLYLSIIIMFVKIMLHFGRKICQSLVTWPKRTLQTCFILPFKLYTFFMYTSSTNVA